MSKPLIARIGAFLCLGLFAVFPTALQAQFGSSGLSSAEKVRVTPYLSVDGVRPGDSFHAAFRLEIENRWHINSHWPSADYLVATEVRLEETPGFQVTESRYPQGRLYRFAFSEEPVDVYEDTVFVYLELRADETLEPGSYKLRGVLRVQACDDKVCLPPSDKPIALNVAVVDAETEVDPIHREIFTSERMYTVGGPATADPTREALDLAAVFDEQGWLPAFLGIFLIGLALNLTPCVYPMLSVTVSIFGSQTGETATSRVFFRALVYVIGISTMYSLLGLMAALSGGLFGSALQSPWVLTSIAVLFLLLALSMFGLYEIQMPHWLTRRLGGTSVAGTLGLYVSGLVVGVFAAPCIGPPIIALLALVGQKGDPLFGFTSFFILSLGLGFPYLILGTFSGLLNRLPRSGEWMVWVKKTFGVVLIALGLFYLSLAFNPNLLYVLIPLVLVAGGIYLGFLEGSRTGSPIFAWIKRASGALVVVVGVFFYLAGQKPSLEWDPYSPEGLSEAHETGRPTILYFAADWCIPCLELDRLTFTDTGVIDAMNDLVRMKVDLTQYDSPESRELRERFNIAGVPTIVFLGPEGEELKELRAVGYIPPADFIRRIESLNRQASAGPFRRAGHLKSNFPAAPLSPGFSSGP